MSVDISQFYQVFFEESLEGLDAMESALMGLNPDDIDSETINTIFRAAHSIKGGSATFGFEIIADFTHVLETLLDEIREGSRGMCSKDVDLFLESVDCMREMIAALQSEGDLDLDKINAMKARFVALLEGQDGAAAEEQEEAPQVGSSREGNATAGWNIFFKPEQEVLLTGNEPLRMFRELGELGDLEVVADVSELPEFSKAHPEHCYLQWNMQLRGDIDKAEVDEVFEWVVDESELRIEPLSESAPAPAEESTDATELADQATAVADMIGSAFDGDPENSAIDSDADVAQTVETVQPPLAASAGDEQSKSASEKSSAGGDNADKNGRGRKAPPKAGGDASIRVGTEKIDQIMNLVGELVINQSMLEELTKGESDEFNAERLTRLQEGLGTMQQNMRELQESVMRIRMLPISFAFSRFPRMVRDLCKQLDKKIDLVLVGEQTELDKTVMEKIGDPLVHLVRNSIDHGIETPDVRRASGKDEMGTVTLEAYHQGGNVVIDISDDGAGLNRDRILAKARENGLLNASEHMPDEQVYDLIFQPGFSTAAAVTDVSGRGVGMDVVRRNIQELNGTVEVKSEQGVGSTFTIRLPLTLAILDGQLVRVGEQAYIFPLLSIVESIQIKRDIVSEVAGGGQVLRVRDEYIPIICLHEVFNIDAEFETLDDGLAVVVEFETRKYAIVVDELLAQQQVVIKSLDENYRPVEGISGATILGEGTVALIVDIAGIVKMGGVRQARSQSGLIDHKLHSNKVA